MAMLFTLDNSIRIGLNDISQQNSEKRQNLSKCQSMKQQLERRLNKLKQYLHDKIHISYETEGSRPHRSAQKHFIVIYKFGIEIVCKVLFISILN